MKEHEDYEQEELYKVEALSEKNLAMSNVLISSKYKATLQELQITFLALQRVQQGKYEERGENIYITFSGSELRKAIGKSSNSFFERLVKTSEHMTGRTIGVVDPEQRKFMFVPFITLAKYENGELTIRFAPEMKNYIVNLERNFTVLSRTLMLGYSREYSFKLYEVLKSFSFYPRDYKGPRDRVFDITLALSELKLTLGVINADLDEVKKELQKNKENPDYDRAVEKAPEKLYDRWTDFKQRVLVPSIAEINEKSDIEVSFKPLAHGRGGKINGVRFFVKDKHLESKKDVPPVELNKNEWSIKAKPSDQEKFALILSAMDILKDVLKKQPAYSEIEDVLDAANYDLEYLKEKKELLSLQKRDEEYNDIGFLIEACKENWKPQKAKKNMFNDFKQNDYDFEELEKALLNVDKPTEE